VATMLALASAITFGAADFIGGLAAKRGRVLGVTALAQGGELLLLIPLLVLLGGVASPAAFTTGAIAGVGGAGGLVLYLRSLAIGPMGVAAPLAAVTGAVLPVSIGLATGERPGVLAATGIVVGLAAVLLATGTDLRTGSRRPPRADRVPIASHGPTLALLGGVGFGVFFVALDASPADSGLWPLLGARAASLGLLVIALRLRRSRLPHDRTAIGLAVGSGVLDMAANALFLAATRTGLLSLTSLIASLYPVVVAVLAASFLRERLDRLQWAGVATCLAAVALIALA
jgi:drug/metabolite transporter (DMT)-like permease